MQDYINDSYFPRKVTIYKIDKFSKLSPTFRYENLCDKMINGIPAITQHNNYYMTERTHVSRHPCFGDDDGDNDTFDMQNTHGQSRFTLPATLPVTRNFSHYPTRTLPEVKKPYSSVSANVTMPPWIDVISLNIG